MRVLTTFCFLFSALSFAAEKEVILNYDGFFDRMDDLNQPEYVDIKLAFYFNQIGKAKACPIIRSEIRSKLNSMEVYFLDSGEVLLPFDEQLDLDKAKLVIVTDEQVECGLNMRLEASFLMTQNMKIEKAKNLVSTFDEGLKELSGMMSFLAPDVTGITFIGSKNHTLNALNAVGDCVENKCTFNTKQLSQLSGEIRFDSVPEKIVPYIAQ